MVNDTTNVIIKANTITVLYYLVIICCSGFLRNLIDPYLTFLDAIRMQPLLVLHKSTEIPETSLQRDAFDRNVVDREKRIRRRRRLYLEILFASTTTTKKTQINHQTL
jgi:hypothetical protein